MRILDKYILKKYLSSFVFILVILIPVIIAVDISEKIDKFLRHADLTMSMIIKDYYINFIINIGNMILPLALFVSVLFFTSKLAGDTEIIAINSARISFTRFLRPYFIGATIVTLLSLLLNHMIVPQSSKVYTDFTMQYIKNRPVSYKSVTNVNLQLSENQYIYIRSYNLERDIGFDFCYEVYEGNKLKEKLLGDNIRFQKDDSTYRITAFHKRIIVDDTGADIISHGRRMDTVFNFMPSDLLHVEAFAKEMRTPELLEYIETSKARGRGSLNAYYVELYKRTSLPLASYILTLMAVSLGSVKRRGGMGINLAVGIGLMFIYIFLLKIVEVIGGAPNSKPLIMVWIPNIIFGSLAIYLYYKARK